MATVQLADIYDPIVFQDLPSVNGIEKTAFYNSGIIVNSPLFTELANSAGTVAELPFWNDLDDTSEENISTDDPTDIAVADKVAQDKMITRKALVNKSWSATNLAMDLTFGKNALQHIKDRTERYWARRWQNRLIKSCNGVMADNVANDAGDMVIDVAIEDGDNALDANLFGRTTFTAAAFTSGDHADDYNAIAVHSTVMKRMSDTWAS